MIWPLFYAITGEDETDPLLYARRCSALLTQGLRCLYLRHRRLSWRATCDVLSMVRPQAQQCGASLFLNSGCVRGDLPKDVGLHCTSHHLIHMKEKPTGRFMSASCHTLEDVQMAEHMCLDFVTLSPVRPTSSHPHTRPLGWEGLRRITHHTRLPVYALGGLTPETLDQARAFGAYGLAALSAFWHSSEWPSYAGRSVQ